MDQAEAVVGDHLGLALAPARQGLCPLPDVAQLVGVPTERDCVAVDDAGDDRRQLTRVGDHKRFVDKPQALLAPPLLEQGAALIVPSEPDQVQIAEAFADLGGLGRSRVPGLPVTPGHLLQPGRDQEITTLDAVLLRLVQQALRASEPATRPSRLASEQHVVADPERAAHSTRRIAGIEVRVMRPLQAAHVIVVAAEQVRRPCEQLQVLRPQRRRLIGARQ